MVPRLFFVQRAPPPCSLGNCSSLPRGVCPTLDDSGGAEGYECLVSDSAPERAPDKTTDTSSAESRVSLKNAMTSQYTIECLSGILDGPEKEGRPFCTMQVWPWSKKCHENCNSGAVGAFDHLARLLHCRNTQAYQF